MRRGGARSYRLEAGLELLTILNHSVVSALYASNCLLLTTATDLFLLLLNGALTTTYLLGHRTSLVTSPPLHSTLYDNHVIYSTAHNPLLPPVRLLPTGPTRVLALFKGQLLLATAAGRVVAFPLNHPAVRFVMLMASGQVDMALRWTRQLRSDQHDAAAYVLQWWGHIEKCLELPGLSPSLRLSFQLTREDVPSIVKIVKKGNLSVFDQADSVNVDYRLTPVDQLPGVRRAAILLAKSKKKEELKKLFKLCQKAERSEDAEFIAMFLYKEDPSLLLSTLKKENKYHGRNGRLSGRRRCAAQQDEQQVCKGAARAAPGLEPATEDGGANIALLERRGDRAGGKCKKGRSEDKDDQGRDQGRQGWKRRKGRRKKGKKTSWLSYQFCLRLFVWIETQKGWNM